MMAKAVLSGADGEGAYTTYELRISADNLELKLTLSADDVRLILDEAEELWGSETRRLRSELEALRTKNA